MAVTRYARAPILDFGAQQGTSIAVSTIRHAISTGRLHTRTIVLKGRERLDTLSGEIYGDSRYWWVLAAASNIGWGLQVPPGTMILIPGLSDVLRLVG